jgi:FkbM family methyltransferase
MRLVSRALSLIPFEVRRQIKVIPGIAQLQRFLVARVLDGREFKHRVDAGPAKGIVFQILMPDDKGIWTGTYENDFATLLGSAIKPGMIAYDIGSWHGFFAGVMAAQGAAEVHVFEPLPANAVRIGHLVAMNPEKSITLHTCAVGERDTVMQLMIMPDSSMAKLGDSLFQAEETSKDSIDVSVRSIDAMIAEGKIAPPQLMKIDVEGAELMVLLGARETIRRYRPIIFAEVHSTELLLACKNILESEGYSVVSIDHDPDQAIEKDVFHIMANWSGRES